MKDKECDICISDLYEAVLASLSEIPAATQRETERERQESKRNRKETKGNKDQTRCAGILSVSEYRP